MSLPSAATRRSCQSVPPYFVALDLVPSCSRQVGDWVETVNGRAGCDGGCGDESENLGDLTSRMRASIRQFIAQYGRVLPNSDGVRAVVVNVFLWDCADQFSSGTGTWSRASDSSCGPITDPDALRRVGRVHIFTVAPFTVYADDVTDSHLYGYWGNAFGDAGTCQQSWSTVPTPAACQLNPLINSAFLVPDE
jgi:hypothetical protein